MARNDTADVKAAPRQLPAHIVLLADRPPHLAGKVLHADANLIAALEADGVKYRAATAPEIAIGGN